MWKKLREALKNVKVIVTMVKIDKRKFKDNNCK